MRADVAFEGAVAQLEIVQAGGSEGGRAHIQGGEGGEFALRIRELRELGVGELQ